MEEITEAVVADVPALELLLEHSLADGLTALQALAAAKALAHEIPLVTACPEPYGNILGLEVLTPYGA